MNNDQCKLDTSLARTNPRYRKALWAALLISTAMFLIEVVGGFRSYSVSLLADAANFAANAASYGSVLAAASMSLLLRARGALIMGFGMGAYGIFVLVMGGWHAFSVKVPEPITMGSIAILALTANVIVVMMLYAFRGKDIDMRWAWLCGRNDLIASLAVMLAALGILGTGSIWPDLIVAATLGWLTIGAALTLVRQARQEIHNIQTKRGF